MNTEKKYQFVSVIYQYMHNTQDFIPKKRPYNAIEISIAL